MAQIQVVVTLNEDMIDDMSDEDLQLYLGHEALALAKQVKYNHRLNGLVPYCNACGALTDPGPTCPALPGCANGLY